MTNRRSFDGQGSGYASSGPADEKGGTDATHGFPGHGVLPAYEHWARCCLRENRLKLMKHSYFVLFFVLLVSSSTTPAAATQQKLTNKDVVKMVKASLPVDVIVQAIKSSTPEFDVSADGLIALKQDGVSDSIIQAMLTRSAPVETQPAQPVSPAFAEADAATRGVFLIDAASRIQMMRATPTGGRTGGVAMAVLNPFGKIKMLQTFSGNHSQLRISNSSPAFEASLPGDINPSDSIVLVKLKVKSDRREISVASGRMGVSTGIDKADMLPISIDELPSKTTSGLSYKTHRVSVVKPLPSGEYALLVQNALYYDFGVDVSR